MKRAAILITLLIAALIFPAVWGGAGEAGDGAPPRLLEWPMLPGESLGGLARLIYPDDILMQRRFITAAVRENPATFSQIGANQKFDRETMIWLPDLKALSRLAVSTSNPHHFLRPALPAMQPGVAGAQPSRLQMSAALSDKPAVRTGNDRQAPERVVLAPAKAISHMNAMPVYDRDSAAAIGALVARNETLKKEQGALDLRIAMLEADISQVRDAIARDRRRPPRRVRRIDLPSGSRGIAPDSLDSLRSPSPLHLLSLAAVLLAGGVIFRARRRRLGDGVAAPVAMPVSSFQSGNAAGLEPGPGVPAANVVQIEENFVDDGFISVDEIASIVEEAKVFVALGRIEYAIEVLEDYVTTHPRASAHPWLYLMEIYRSTQNRAAFETVAKRFHLAMNVVTPQWESAGLTMMVVANSLEEFPHILARLAEGWGTRDAQDFLNHLLQDNRGGERQGFSMEVLQEILLLLAVIELRDHLPPLKPF